MIEADKMLYLRRYALTILRADAKSRVVRTLHTATPTSSGGERGYAFRYASSSARAAYVAAELSRSNYVACIRRLFGTTVAQSSVDDIDQKLMSLCEDAKRGQVSADRLREIIRLCDENGYQLDDNTGVRLLKYCGDLPSTAKTSERRDLADQVWQLAGKNGDAALTLEHYNMLLHVHAMNGSSVSPSEFLASMSVQPNEDTYRLLLNVAIKADDSEHLREAMSMIKERNISLDEDMLCALMRTYFVSNNISNAEDVIKLAKNAKLPMDKLYTELACGYATLGDIPNLVKILNDEPQGDMNLLKIIKSLITSGNGRHIPVVMNFLMASIPAIESDILRTITELVHTECAADAHAIVNCLVLNTTPVDGAKTFVNSFLTELVMINAPVKDVAKYASDYVDSGCDPRTFTDIAEIGLKLGREDLCLTIFDMMQKKNIEVRPHYYWPLLTIAHKTTGEKKVFSLVKSMVDIGVEMDYETLTTRVYPYVNTADPITTLKRLQTIGVPAVLLQTPMISFLLFQNRMQDVVILCEYFEYMKLHYRSLLKPLAQAYFVTRDTESCAKLLSTFENGHEFVVAYLLTLLANKRYDFYIEDLQFLLEAFKKYNVRIQKKDAEILKNKLANVNIRVNMNLSKMINSLIDYSLEKPMVALIPRSRYMNSKELVCLLVELKSKEYSLRNVLNQLFESYCMENNLKKVEEVKREMEENQMQMSFGKKMYLFELYLRHNKLKEAEEILLNVPDLSDSLMIDNNKFIMFVNALVNADRLKSAFNILTNFVHVDKKKNAERQCFTLLDTVAHSKHYACTKDIFELLVQKNYCTITTKILKPLVTASLRENDLLSTVNMFMKCARMYKKTPLAQEVLTALLREKDNSTLLNMDKYIEEVYNTLARINGPEVANTSLIIALATLNKTEELQTIVKERSMSMISLMRYFQEGTNATDILSRILEATADATNIHQNVLCDMLLSSYSKESNCDSALALWEKMRAKDIEPTDHFKKNFIQLLLMNKVSLPSEFESYNNKVENSN